MHAERHAGRLRRLGSSPCAVAARGVRISYWSALPSRARVVRSRSTAVGVGPGPHSQGGVVRGILPVLGVLVSLIACTGVVYAEPVDDWDYAAYDCLNDRWNPLDENGNRTGADPEPGTAEWTAFNTSHVECTDQRDNDRAKFPLNDSARSAAQYGTDPYRVPDAVRERALPLQAVRHAGDPVGPVGRGLHALLGAPDCPTSSGPRAVRAALPGHDRRCTA